MLGRLRKIYKMSLEIMVVLVLLAGCSPKAAPVSEQPLTKERIITTLKDLKLVGIGDSLMRGYVSGDKKAHDSFCEYLKQDYSMSINNYSADGAGWSPVGYGTLSYKAQLSRVKKNTENGMDYDILLLEGGGNTLLSYMTTDKEISAAKAIGSMKELDDTTKVSGLVEDNLSEVYDYFHTKSRYIFYLYPALNPELAKSKLFVAYKAFMTKYCKEKGIIMIDLGQVGMEYNDIYYSDQVHYTDKGYQLTSDYVAEQIARVIKRCASSVTPTPSKELPSITPEGIPGKQSIATPEATPEATSVAAVVTPSGPTQSESGLIPTMKAVKKADSLVPQKVFTVIPQNDETAQFSRFYYLDNSEHLNVFYWQYNIDSGIRYTSCRWYQQQEDGMMKATRIIWNRDADKIMNLAHEGKNEFCVMTQWKNEKNGDFYLIVSKYPSDLSSNPAYVYGIHPDGTLFANIKLDDYLVMDKISPKIYTCGFTINYIGQENGTAYFDFKDNSKNAVIYYDMDTDSFTKQVFTTVPIKGFLDGKYVGVNKNQLILESVPEVKMTATTKGSIEIGQSEVLHKYDIPEHEAISVNGKYVYILSKNKYQRLIPGEDQWESLADVTQIMGTVKGDLYLDDLIAKDGHFFSLLFYADCGDGFYIDGYRVE